MATTIKEKTRKDHLRDIYNDYRSEHPYEVEVDPDDVAAWAIRNDHWYPKPRNLRKQCASELTEALREDFEEDPQGRRVRKNHAVRSKTADGKQQVLWADIKEASPQHMRTSLQQRRRGVLSDCAQLKRDTDSYNENNDHGVSIPMTYDFSEDLFEMEAPEDYPEPLDETEYKRPAQKEKQVKPSEPP